MIGFVTACSVSKNENYNSRGYYSKEAFGQFPNAPGSNKSPKIDILVGPGKPAPQFVTKKLAKIQSGLNLNCEVKANSVLTAIGDAGNYFLVQSPKFALSQPCASEGYDGDFFEGYISKNDVISVAIGKSTNGGNSLGDAAQTISQEKLDGKTLSDGLQGFPNNTLGDTKTAGKTCDNVAIISLSGSGLNWPTEIIGDGDTIPGEFWRKRTDGDYSLAVGIQADEFLIQAKRDAFHAKEGSYATSMTQKRIKSSELAKSSNNYFVIPFAKFVDRPNDWSGASITISVAPQNAAGEALSGACDVKIRLASPLVLDFSGKKKIETKAVVSSGIKFDLNADGRTEQVGWVNGQSAAFLVLDINGNGLIDDGSEMFGEATVVSQSKKKASEGFAALSQYDSNLDGVIDSKDPIFKKLALWFDKNGNGKTNPGELVSVTAKKLSFISLKSTELPRGLALQHLNSIPNDVRTSAVFGARGCPVSGCKIYDIFFGSIDSMEVSMNH